VCRNQHIPARNPCSRPSIVLDSVSILNPSTMRPIPIKSKSGVAQSRLRRTLHISTIPETLVCPGCQLSQFERGNAKCRRCQQSLGISYIEIFLTDPLTPLNSQRQIAARLEVGRLIRRLRSRRGVTQAALASMTGIHRTYLSRAEHGQVLPSVVALMQILRALGVDKMLLRVRSPSS
jgi:DNA-binding XRE family transcriptional regulator